MNQVHPLKSAESDPSLPSPAELAAFRAYLEGIETKDCVARYLPERLANGRTRSARGVLGEIKRSLVLAARQRHLSQWVALLRTAKPRMSQAAQRRIYAVLNELPAVPIPTPQLTDEVQHWLAPRAARCLHAAGIHTLSDLTVRIPRRQMWWRSIEGYGRASARQIEHFFAAHPELTEQARVLLQGIQQSKRLTWTAPSGQASTQGLNSPQPWDQLRIPKELDGSQGKLRAPKRGCLLAANTDYEAVNAWIALQESPSTKRAYRKEVERLMLWAIFEGNKPLSSLTSEDAMAYRAFLRKPTPTWRWIGPVAPRGSVEWRPFQGGLSVRSTAYALSVLSALFRWLTEQRYLTGNPFAGVNAKASRAGKGNAATSSAFHQKHKRAFTEKEWQLVMRWAAKAEKQLGWSKAAAARLTLILNFTVATGLRVSELSQTKLGDIEVMGRTQRWIKVLGKGNKLAPVAVPPMAWAALQTELKRRGIRGTAQNWSPETPVVAAMDQEDADAVAEVGLSTGRIWTILKRFFGEVADQVESKQPQLADKLRAASPHWLRHTHATMALQGGAELVTVRDNLRHASLTTTSGYLHTDESRRAKQLGKVFR